MHWGGSLASRGKQVASGGQRRGWCLVGWLVCVALLLGCVEACWLACVARLGVLMLNAQKARLLYPRPADVWPAPQPAAHLFFAPISLLYGAQHRCFSISNLCPGARRSPLPSKPRSRRHPPLLPNQHRYWGHCTLPGWYGPGTICPPIYHNGRPPLVLAPSDSVCPDILLLHYYLLGTWKGWRSTADRS